MYANYSYYREVLFVIHILFQNQITDDKNVKLK